MLDATQTAKANLRKQLLQQRSELPPVEWQNLSHSLCQHLQASDRFQQSRTILAYISTRQEPDLVPLFGLPNLIWGIPRCQGEQLQWHTWSPPSPELLVPGKYGIWEPHPQLAQLQPDAVDLILVPAVACDQQGYRLGYGGGYYDRCLSQPAWQSIPTIGIVFDFAYVPQLPRALWDLPLQAICTNLGYFVATSSQPDSANSQQNLANP